MKNVDLIRKFENGATSGKCGNLKIVGNCLINYSTIGVCKKKQKKS